MKRSEIHEALYNPRIITDAAKKKLKDKMKVSGLLQPLVVNKRTGNLVSGHQRLHSLDSLERGKDYELDVSIIDVDEKAEKELNVFFNNPSAMGEWDLQKLADLNLVDEIDFTDMGFEKYDVDILFDGDSRFSDFFVDSDTVAKTGEALEKIKESRKKGVDKMREKNEAQFYFVVVCKDDNQKSELMRSIGVPVFEQFVEGAYLLENIKKGGLGKK